MEIKEERLEEIDTRLLEYKTEYYELEKRIVEKEYRNEEELRLLQEKKQEIWKQINNLEKELEIARKIKKLIK